MPNGIGAKGQQAKTPANPLPPKLSTQTRKKGAKPGAPPNFAPFACEALIRRANRAPPGPHQDSVYASPSHTLTFGA